MTTLFLHGIGHFRPENVIDNAFLEALDIGTTDEWILERVGIRTRRTVLPLDYIRHTRNRDLRAAHEAALYSNVETGRRAAQLALARAGLRTSDIGLLIAGGCAADMKIPAEACRIAAAMGIECPAFDLGSACSSFVAALHVLRQMSELADFVLVVNPENTTRVVDYSDRSSAVLWGDGSSAAVVSTRVPSRIAIRHTGFASSPEGHGAVRIPDGGHFAQEGSAVQHFAVRTTVSCVAPLVRAHRARPPGSRRLRFVGHQANLLMLQAIARRLELEPEEHWCNVVDYGNTGAAGAPSVLSEHWDDLRAGDEVLLAAVGSGLSWGSVQMEVTR